MSGEKRDQHCSHDGEQTDDSHREVRDERDAPRGAQQAHAAYPTATARVNPVEARAVAQIVAATTNARGTRDIATLIGA